MLLFDYPYFGAINLGVILQDVCIILIFFHNLAFKQLFKYNLKKCFCRYLGVPAENSNDNRTGSSVDKSVVCLHIYCILIKSLLHI